MIVTFYDLVGNSVKENIKGNKLLSLLNLKHD